ncbi:MAG: hypothetical protein M3P11_01630 [Actinomycetota bacterium]|nr:hypothetical protein [Actinomycetota bacterium]
MSESSMGSLRAVWTAPRSEGDRAVRAVLAGLVLGFALWVVGRWSR